MKFIVFICSMIFMFSSFAKETITLANGEWAPYLSEKEDFYGMWSHVVTEAFAQENIDVKYEFFPWSRALELGKKGRVHTNTNENCCDGTLMWRKTPERETDFYFSEPVFDVGYVFFAMKGLKNKENIPFEKIKWKDVKELAEFSIGGTNDYDYGTEFKKLEKDKVINIEYASSELKNLKKLQKGRIEIIPVGLDVGLAILKDNYSWDEREKFTFNPISFEDAPMYLLLSKKDPNNKILMEKFNAGLKKLKDTSKYKEIIDEFRKKLQNK